MTEQRLTKSEQHLAFIRERYGPTAYWQALDSEWISTSPGSPGYEDEEDREILREREKTEQRG
jgi:hypothetical protein